MQNPSPEVLKFVPFGSVADIHQYFEFRLAIEPVAARLAATQRDVSDLIAITINLEALEIRQTGVLGAYDNLAFINV